MKETVINRARAFPLPGQRILRTMIAIWLCMLIYLLRGRTGLPFLAVIASIQCIQPYTKNMRQMGTRRIIGTLIGAVWGSLMLYLEFLFVGTGQMEEALRLFLAGGCAGAVLYSTVLIRIPERAYFSTIVFLGIIMNHATDADPSVYIINRLIDTVIGIAVGTAVNSLHLPRIRHEEILFASGIGHVAPGEKHQLTPYTKVELNRLMNDGAKFTIVTHQSPATIREVMEGVSLKYPVIAMNGAVLYDMENRHYLYAEKISEDLAVQIGTLLMEKQAQHFIMTLEDDLLTIYYHEMVEGTMKQRYLAKRRSLYRNYVRTDRVVCEDVLYFVAMGDLAEIEPLAAEILSQPWSSRCRIEFDDFDCEENERILRIYSKQATRERMLLRLKQELKAETMVKFGKEETGFDQVFPYRGDRMVKKIKELFEPVDLRGWRNIWKY